MRKQVLIMLLIISPGLLVNLVSQEISSISEQRKENIMKLLDYRFKGGYYSFEKLFHQTVEYPPVAASNCILGISIVSFKVNCEGEVHNLMIKTKLGFGIDNEIASFLASTSGLWNKCHDDKYTNIELPIQFVLEGTETNREDALLVMESDNPGFLCNSDEYYINKIEKYMEKEKYKRALQYIEVMIRRDPYNTYYFDMKKKAMGIED